MADSARWDRFELLLDRTDLGAPIAEISPWLDMLIRSDDEVFGMLAAQEHRRFIKTHTPLDGVPYRSTVTYIAMVRHPLDVVLSDLDHTRNTQPGRATALRDAATGEPEPLVGHVPPPDDPAGVLRWFIDNDNPPTGSGPNGLADFCQQALTFWAARDWHETGCRRPRRRRRRGAMGRVRSGCDARLDARPSRTDGT